MLFPNNLLGIISEDVEAGTAHLESVKLHKQFVQTHFLSRQLVRQFVRKLSSNDQLRASVLNDSRRLLEPRFEAEVDFRWTRMSGFDSHDSKCNLVLSVCNLDNEDRFMHAWESCADPQVTA